MTDLAEFLLARIAEDEAAARWAAEEVGDGHWQQRGARIVTVADRDREVADYAIVECIDHVVRHGPARVLAECEAKRRIVELHNIDHDPCDAHDAMMRSVPCETLQALALPYADHAEWREEWRT